MRRDSAQQLYHMGRREGYEVTHLNSNYYGREVRKNKKGLGSAVISYGREVKIRRN